MSKTYSYPEDRLPTPKNSKLLALIGEKKTVLEIGCGMGYHSRALRDLQGCHVTGIEIDAKSAEHARQYCDDLIVADIEALDVEQTLTGRSFDIISFADVLEHLRSPTQALMKIRPLLSATGYIVASIPNITHCSVLYEMARGEFRYRTLGLLDDTHIRFFTHKSIYETFESAGYLIVSLDRIVVPPAETEFSTQPQTEDDRRFLQYINRHNREAETYQFVVKAIPATGAEGPQAELISAHNKMQQMDIDYEYFRNRIRELESNIEWITRRPIYRLLSAIRRSLTR